MVSTRAASQLPATEATTAQPPVDHFSDADLTDVEELERQLAASTAGTQQTVNTGTGQPSPLQPEVEPQTATPPTAQQLAHLLQGLQAPSPAPRTTIDDTVLTTLAQAVTALTAHLATPGAGGLNTGARAGPPPATIGEDPRVEPVRSRFPAVDPTLLVEILENRFKVENLLKLNASFIYTPERRQENIYLGSIEVPTSRREVKLEEYHNLSWLMEPFEIYCQVLVEFAHEHIKVPLAAALGDYRRRLYELNRRCTWESIRHFHFSFHRKRVLTGVHLPSGWREIEPEFLPLLVARQSMNQNPNPRKRPAPDDGEGSFARRITGPRHPAHPHMKIPDACRRHNTYGCNSGNNCNWRHVCYTCGNASHISTSCSTLRQGGRPPVTGANAA
jgi:Uma2 family endonuclease